MLRAGSVADGRAARGEVRTLTALRALAAWFIVLYHFSSFLQDGSLLRRVLHQGAYSVDLFFVMSGYVMARQYGWMFASGVEARTVARFIGIRLARIYPLHALMLVLFVSIPLALAITNRPPARFYDAPDFVHSLLLVQDWGFAQPFVWNVPAWSISAELAFCLMFPLIAHFASRWVTPGRIALAGAAMLAASGAKGLLSGGLIFDMGHYGILRCVVSSMLGVCVYRASLLSQPGPRTSLAMIAAGVALVSAIPAGVPDVLAVPLGCTAVVWGLLEPTNPVSRALDRPVLLWLGRVSYATYLSHYLVRDWLSMLLLDRIPLWLVAVVYGILVVLVSGLLHRRVERPAQKWLRAWVERRFGPRQQALGRSREA